MKRNYYLIAILVLLLSVGSFAQSDPDCATLNPIVESTEINMCEPGGKVTLEAQESAGNAIYWYDTATSEERVHKGNNYDLGDVSETISYWVTEVKLNRQSQETGQGKLKPSSTNNPFSNDKDEVGLAFEADEEFVLYSVEVYPDANGELEVSLIDLNTKETILSHREYVKKSLEKPIVIILDFEIPVGKYHLVQTSNHRIALLGDTYQDGVTYPYSLGKDGKYGKITAGAGGNDKVSSRAYNYFYNWVIEGPMEFVCESDKKEIVINVNDYIPPAPEIDTTYTFCGSEAFTLADIQFSNELEGAIHWLDDSGNEIVNDTEVKKGDVYFAVQNVGGCTSDLTEVTIEILEMSDLPVAEAEQHFEEGSGDTLASLIVEGLNLRWYADIDKEEELSEDTELEDATTYYVTQTLENHCESKPVGISVSEILGINDIVFEELKYTNPVNNVLHLSNSEAINSVTLYDLTGKKISLETLNTNFYKTEVDLSNLTQGVYLLRLKVKDRSKTIKIIKN